MFNIRLLRKSHNATKFIVKYLYVQDIRCFIDFVSTNRLVSLTASIISSTYKTKNMYLLSLTFIYIYIYIYALIDDVFFKTIGGDNFIKFEIPLPGSLL